MIETAIQEQAAADRIGYAIEREAWGREVAARLVEFRARTRFIDANGCVIGVAP